jgi:redox-sensitive bicupin YhaK (pirin superfamily)
MSNVRVFHARAVSDGAGVKINRVAHMSDPSVLDPFLLVDEIHSDQPEDYMEGFPSHPHRGFETVTVMLKGKMRHQDHLGNNGVISAGGGQWMTTGRGVIHSEMPEQERGVLHGFQLWLNLPSTQKMQPASYSDLKADEWLETLIGHITIRGLGGTLTVENERLIAPMNSGETKASVYTLTAKARQTVHISHPENRRFFFYIYQDEVEFQGAVYHRGSLVVIDDADRLELRLGEKAGVLMLSGRPLNEAVAQYGPFVMNTMAEVEQAILDYREHSLV